ncbi:MAG: metallophosphoesterase [Clostridia bacterium]|nr:metallophosphoesterase [Clostridia bacterium]
MTNEWRYTQTDPSRVVVREIEIDSGRGGDEVVIVHMTDPHFNAHTENDLKNPILASTIEHRKWQAGGASVPNLERCLEYAKGVNADQVVITGDVLDFLSEGCINLMNEHLWAKYPDTIVSLGNHELAYKVQGKLPDDAPIEPKYELLQKNWNHDIRYSAKVLGDKVMIIQMDNASAWDFGNRGFFDIQVEPLKRDLTLAREKGYTVLLFYHTPMSTEDRSKDPVKSSMVGDKNMHTVNFAHIGIASYIEGATGEIYRMITSNADIIKGCFCGHFHSDFYTELKATNADGTDAVIPQYVLMGTPYGKGHVLKITVK